jgi:signal transduction histidine kinase
MAKPPRPPAGAADIAPSSPETLTGLVPGIRLIALGVVAALGALLLRESRPRMWLSGGLVLSAAVGFAQQGLVRRRATRAGNLLSLVQAGIWTGLIHASGGQRSPLFVGYLLEVPLAGGLLGRRGGLLSALAGTTAYLVYSGIHSRPLDHDAVALMAGSMAVTGLFTWLLIGVLDRQQRTISAARAVLTARAEDLATEIRLLGEYLSGALLSLDDLGRVETLNPVAQTLVEAEARSVIGHPWQEVLRPDAATAGRIARVLAEGEAQRGFECVLHRRDGTPVTLRGEAWVSPSARGRRTHVFLDTRPQGISGEDPIRRLGEAAACVAHQIKNSLQVLRALAHSAERGSPGRVQGLDPQRLLAALDSLGELTDDVLGLAGPGRPVVERVSLCEALSSAVLLIGPAGARVSVDAGPRPLHVLTHRGRLVHALFNLLDNACRVTPSGRAVRVRVERAGEEARVEIMDGGPGLPLEWHTREEPIPSQNGSGWGVIAARRFLEGAGGRIAFEPVAGGGTLCRVLLPAHAGP